MLKRTLTTGKVVDAMIHDARTIAICRQHGVKTLWSAGTWRGSLVFRSQIR